MGSSYKSKVALQEDYGDLPAVGGPFIQQVAGTDKGKVFELAGNQLTIGRALDNDIIVQSEAISRLHAHMAESDGAWYIRDNGSKNGVIVNGQKVAEAWLTSGDIVQIGDFIFRFNQPQSAGHSQSGASPEMDMPEMDMGMGAEPAAAPDMGGFPAPTAPKKQPNRRVLVYGVVALLLGAVLMMDNEGDEGTSGASAGKSGKLDRDFSLSQKPDMMNVPREKNLVGSPDPLLTKAEQEMKKLDWTNSSLKKSESFFKKGQREYLAKNYHRAIENFSTALALYGGHLLADRYLRKAVYEAELRAKDEMALGVRYYTTLQYQRAIYHFKQVVTLMAHRKDEKIIKDAQTYIGLSEKALKAAELFP